MLQFKENVMYRNKHDGLLYTFSKQKNKKGEVIVAIDRYKDGCVVSTATQPIDDFIKMFNFGTFEEEYLNK
jgi:hypothetical protein